MFVLVLDALHVASARTQVVCTRAAEFVDAYVGPADLTAVLSPGGLAAATQDFTSDKPRLLAAIQQSAGSKIRPAMVEVAEEEAARQRDPIAVALHNGKDPSDEERAGRAQALADVLDARPVPGRESDRHPVDFASRDPCRPLPSAGLAAHDRQPDRGSSRAMSMCRSSRATGFL